MRDLTNPKLIWLKAGLFLGIGMTSALLLLMENPGMRTALLLGALVWSCSRAYYFAFYVVQHYLDPTFRYAGFFHFLRYLLNRSRSSGSKSDRSFR